MKKLTRGKVEFIGYAARAAAHEKTGKLMPYVIQNVYILVAPALFAASIYMTLGRVVRAVCGEQYSIIPAKWLTKLFVTGDVASFVIQGGAAGLMVTGSHAKVGQALIILGLVVQVVSFALFGVTAAIFFKRMSALPTRESYTAGVSWKRILVMLFVCSALIFVRSIFRVVEYAMGVDGYLLTHEWTLYVFDSLLMWIVMVVFFWQYPSHLSAKVSDSEAQTYYHSHLRVPSEEGNATTKMASSESVWSVARS
ncbi:hypothetical protein FH972_024222 [Carpinus fangiana]|uniref:Uncharacterized protein n=1 Tax=Carpinus fangiana TaxID=176857 RepID=A0A5N6KXS7_9ROSI|nr:hypothetical protein FH972_024222 [Carpinus fangiana]